ncbi:MAG TPA: 30S ribosomal protein S20 [Nitrospirota bacterium]|nr:30S ribosomal protein S20 [Nitrospirota bacterium]
MANHKSAIKRNKQSVKKRERNRAAKGALRTVIKKFNTAVAKEPETAKELLEAAVPAIARAGSKGIIHKNNAARRISRLTKKLNKAGQGA